jgi:hypothetical protein
MRPHGSPEELQRRCERAMALFEDGYPPVEVARRVGVDRRNVRRWYGRHRWQVEGVHGEAKTQHGLRRAVRRGLTNVAIQVYLTAAVMNLKGLVVLVSGFLWPQNRMFCPQRDVEASGLLTKRLWGRYQQKSLILGLAA